jgi:hypothetical protein
MPQGRPRRKHPARLASTADFDHNIASGELCEGDAMGISADRLPPPWIGLAVVCWLWILAAPGLWADDAAGIAFFESRIRPVLVEHCQECHAADSKPVKGGLRLDSRAGILAGGADLEQVRVNLSDTTAIEAQRFGVFEVARMFNVPPTLLGAFDSTFRATADEAAAFLKFCLGPRLRRIESALRADPDLFGGTDLYPEFKVDALLRSDTAERYTAYKVAREAGWLSANEVRELENYPAVPDGDNVQQTPVGGAPNPTPET